jgi:hypothetical protein
LFLLCKFFMQVPLLTIVNFIFKQCNVIFFLFYISFSLLWLFFFKTIFVMFIIDEASRKKLPSEGSIEKNVLENLKKILPSSFFYSNKFFDLHSYGFYPTTPFYYTILDY